MLARIGLLVLVSTSLLACKKEKAVAPPTPAPPAPAIDESLFIIARPTVTRMALPAHFAGPLPASVADAHERAYPPRPFVRAALSANTHQMRRRFVDGLARAAAAGPIPEQLAGFYTDLVGYGPGPDVCKWLAETGASPALPQAARDVAWQATRFCRDASFAALIAGDDVPDGVIVEWYFSQHDDDELPYDERVARAAMNVARTAKDDDDVRRVGFVFARMKGAEAVAAITKLQAELPDAHRRALAGVGMLRSKSAAGQAIGQRACKHPKVSNDAMCGREGGTYVGGLPKKPADLPGLIEYGEEPKQLLEKFPRADVLAALTSCAQTGRDYRRRACFEQLLDLDRAAALDLAKQLVTNDDARTAQLARSLLKYPDAARAEKALRELGFALDKARDRDGSSEVRAPITVQDVLVARGRSKWFDVETGMFPNEHDGLLADLAALAKPVLDTVVFEELPPNETDEDRGIYMLHAYVDGMRYSLPAENHGDWYDVEAVVGLVNALLVAKQSDTRLVVLPTGDQTTIVVAGPARGIQSLANAKLIDLGDPRESERVGKDSEDRAFEALQKEGHEVLHRDVRLPAP